MARGGKRVRVMWVMGRGRCVLHVVIVVVKVMAVVVVVLLLLSLASASSSLEEGIDAPVRTPALWLVTQHSVVCM